MTKISFKKEHKEGLFTYLHVHNSSYQSMPAAKEQPMTYPDREASNPIVYQTLFYNYLSLAQYCCRNLEKYCILHSSPDTHRNKVYFTIGHSKAFFSGKSQINTYAIVVIRQKIVPPAC